MGCRHCFPVERGFTLVVTLMVMVLLTVVTVGILSLSTITLRSSRGDLEGQEGPMPGSG